MPQLLDPFIRLPPESSLLLLTGVLDATPFWLIPRFLSAVLSGEDASVERAGIERAGDHEAGDTSTQRADVTAGQDVKVVLVSWMRDWETWRTEGRRGGVWMTAVDSEEQS